MNKLKYIISGIVVIVILGLMIGIGQSSFLKPDVGIIQGDSDTSKDNADSEDENLSSCDVAHSNALEARKQKVLDQISKMDNKAKIGQLLIVSIPGPALDSGTAQYLQNNKIGNVLLFGKNIISPEQTQELTKSLKQNALEFTQIPLFIGVDEEGGRVSRVPAPMEKTPAAKKIGDTKDPEKAYQAGRLIAQNLKGLGINLDFAPVCDVNTNPDNPVIGDRAFSSDPEIAAQMAKRFYNGLKEGGVLGSAKHFPGHGDTSLDSHLQLPSVDTDVQTLKERELIPFQALVNAQVDMVMTSHIVIQSIDKDYPATLSKKVKQELLFDYLNYQGIVVSDDMAMKAIADNYTDLEAAKLAIESGCDLLILSYDAATVTTIAQHLEKSLDSGELSRERVDGALYKILMKKGEL